MNNADRWTIKNSHPPAESFVEQEARRHFPFDIPPFISFVIAPAGDLAFMVRTTLP